MPCQSLQGTCILFLCSEQCHVITALGHLVLWNVQVPFCYNMNEGREANIVLGKTDCIISSLRASKLLVILSDRAGKECICQPPGNVPVGRLGNVLWLRCHVQPSCCHWGHCLVKSTSPLSSIMIPLAFAGAGLVGCMGI